MGGGDGRAWGVTRQVGGALGSWCRGVGGGGGGYAGLLIPGDDSFVCLSVWLWIFDCLKASFFFYTENCGARGDSL